MWHRWRRGTAGDPCDTSDKGAQQVIHVTQVTKGHRRDGHWLQHLQLRRGMLHSEPAAADTQPRASRRHCPSSVCGSQEPRGPYSSMQQVLACWCWCKPATSPCDSGQRVPPRPCPVLFGKPQPYGRGQAYVFACIWLH